MYFIRWLSHGAACKRIADRFEEIVDCLDALYDDRKEADVYGLRRCLMQKEVIAMILLLADVLQIINHLSLFLQKDNMNFNDIKSKVKVNE